MPRMDTIRKVWIFSCAFFCSVLSHTYPTWAQSSATSKHAHPTRTPPTKRSKAGVSSQTQKKKPAAREDLIDLSHLATGSKRPSKTSKKKTKQTPSKDLNTTQLQTIVVTGARRARKLKDTVTQTEVITRKQIQQTSARRLSELLQTQLGVQVTPTAGAGSSIQIQGLDSKYILILVDGQRINGRVRGVIDLDRFPLERIERIEIVKGATSALYGSDAIGGVIHIITRKNKRPFFVNAAGRYGYGDSHLVDLSGSTGFYWKGWSGQISLSWLRHDSWDLDPKDLATTGGSDNQFQISGRTGYRFSKHVTLTAQGHYQFRDRASVDSNSVGAVYDRKNRTETSGASVFLNALLRSNVRLRWKTGFSYFRDQYLNEKRNASQSPEVQQTYDWMLQSVAQLDLGIGESHFISLGLDGMFERIQSPRIEEQSASRGRIALFAQYEWMIQKPLRISIVPGIRAGYDTQYSFAVNPKLSTRIDIVPGWIVRASYGWGFRAPDFKELYLKFENSAAGYVVIGNPQLKPEYARSLQVGMEWSTLRWLILRAQFYRNDLDNLIDTRNLDGPGRQIRITYQNIRAAVTQGVETQVVLSYKKYIQFSVGYNYLWSQDQSTQKALLGRSAHTGNAQIFAQIPQWGLRLSVRGTFAGPREMLDDADQDGTPERILLDPYVLLHAKLGYLFYKRMFEAYVSVQNITSTGDVRWLPIRPRTFFVGVRFSK